MLVVCLTLGAFFGHAGAQFDPCLFPQLVPWCHSCPDFSLHWDQKPWEWFNKDGPGEVTIQYFSSAIRDQLTEEPGQIWELGDAVSCQVSGLNQDIENGAMDEVGVSISTPSSWNGKRDIKLLTHGFTDSVSPIGDKKSVWAKFVKAWMDKHDDTDVILVDWSKKSGNPNNPVAYDGTAQVAVDVGRWLGLCLGELKDAGKIGNLHMAGHSLGAHLLGKAARTLTSWTSGEMVDRLTGLDPAGPRWTEGLFCQPIPYLLENRLRQGSALFMDIIHTNGGTKPSVAGTLWPSFGMRKPMGDLDFYPSGGQWQPGCNDYIVGGDGPCSHGRAVKYFYWSIKDPKMLQIRACTDPYGDCAEREGSNDDSSPFYMGEFMDPNSVTTSRYWYRNIQKSCWDFDAEPGNDCVV